MKQSLILLTFIITVCFYGSCTKKDNQAVVSGSTKDSVKQIIITYPYTDTFSGGLDIWSDMDTTEYGYMFYVLHVNSDSIIFISSNTINEESSWIQPRDFYNGYRMNSTHTYLFQNLYGADHSDADASRYPPNGSFILSDTLLQINWQDVFSDECRLMHPTGGIQDHTSSCYYTGTLVRH